MMKKKKVFPAEETDNSRNVLGTYFSMKLAYTWGLRGETYPKRAVGVYCYKANNPKLSDCTQHLYNISHISADLSWLI